MLRVIERKYGKASEFAIRSTYNPKTGNLYLAASESGMKYGFEEIKVISNVRHFGAYQEFIWGNEVQVAVNAKTGNQVWRNEESKPGYAGGMLTTAGNLVFTDTARMFSRSTVGPSGKAPPPYAREMSSG